MSTLTLVEQSVVPPAPAAGRVKFYVKDGILYTVDDAGTVTPIAALGDVLMAVRNETGSSIAKGKAVYVSGFSIPENLKLVALADKDNPARRPSVGLADTAIADGANGQVRISGTLTGIDTSAWSLTDQLVLGTNGALSRPPPDESPFTGEIQPMAVVTRVDAVDGEIVLIVDGLNAVTADQVFALAGTNGTPGPSNKYVTDSDPRNTNARTPTAHAASHKGGGSDVIDNATTSLAGLMSATDKTKLDGIAAGAVSDHGALTGLADDDHTQYILVNGTRAFSGVVAGVTPTAGSHLATKSYVDALIEGIEWQDSVFDRDLATPPGSPSTGDRYIVASSPTGAWSGHTNHIAEWNGAAWQFTVPTVGMSAPVDDENVYLRWNGSAWTNFGASVDHGALAGLGDDDHTQYHNNTRGDARYFQKTEFIATSAGAGDAGKPVKTGASGRLPTSLIDDDAITFAKIQNITTDRLLGRDTAATGDVEEIQIGGGLEFTGGPGIQTSAFTGDVTKTAGGTVQTIASDAVTFAKMQNLATDTLIGRDTTGTGDPEAISVTGGLEFTGSGGIQRSALTGDLTASAGSNATTIANNAVTDAKLRDSAALSVIGRSANSTGDPADIAAGTDKRFLGREGTTLGFFTPDTLAEDFNLSGVISPSQITADQDNYNPTNLATSSTLRLNTDARRRITGVQGGAAGRFLFLINVGSFPIVIGHENASSTAANRVVVPGARDAVIQPDEVKILIYDATTARWRFRDPLRVLRAVPYMADVMDLPVNADFPVTVMAPTDRDGANNGVYVVTYDDTTEQGRGVPEYCPGSTFMGANAGRILLMTIGKPATAPAAARTVGRKLYYRDMTDNGTWSAWSSVVLPDADITANLNWQYDYDLYDLGSGGGQINITAGRRCQFLLTRVNPTAGTELVGDWNLDTFGVAWLQ